LRIYGTALELKQPKGYLCIVNQVVSVRGLSSQLSKINRKCLEKLVYCELHVALTKIMFIKKVLQISTPIVMCERPYSTTHIGAIVGKETRTILSNTN
jgi:hypothetical protein